MSTRRWWSTSSGRIELQIDADDALCCGGQGQQDDNVRGLSEVPYIRDQLVEIPAALIASELKEYGAWDEVERTDTDQNIQRLLWVACCDIAEEIRTIAE